jgi:hypothetical protein
MATIQMSDVELMWLYIPLPITATQIEVEKWFRDNAFNLSVHFCREVERFQKEDKAMEEARGSTCH